MFTSNGCRRTGARTWMASKIIFGQNYENPWMFNYIPRAMQIFMGIQWHAWPHRLTKVSCIHFWATLGKNSVMRTKLIKIIAVEKDGSLENIAVETLKKLWRYIRHGILQQNTTGNGKHQKTTGFFEISSEFQYLVCTLPF